MTMTHATHTIWEKRDQPTRLRTRERSIVVQNDGSIAFTAVITGPRGGSEMISFVATPDEMREIVLQLTSVASYCRARSDGSLLGRWRHADGVVITVISVHDDMATIKTDFHKAMEWTRADVIKWIEKPGTVYVGAK